jgi:hypothetical protein
VESPVVVSPGTSVNIITLKACRRLGRRVIISERNDPRRLPMQKTWNWADGARREVASPPQPSPAHP